MSKLTIYAGKEFSADFTVVSDDGVTGIILEDSDTGTFDLLSNGNNPTCVIGGIPMTITDKDNGVFNLTLTADQTSVLSQDICFKEDKYATLSNYKGMLDFKLAAGDRQATIDIYVEETPTCPVT